MQEYNKYQFRVNCKFSMFAFAYVTCLYIHICMIDHAVMYVCSLESPVS